MRCCVVCLKECQKNNIIVNRHNRREAQENKRGPVQPTSISLGPALGSPNPCVLIFFKIPGSALKAIRVDWPARHAKGTHYHAPWAVRQRMRFTRSVSRWKLGAYAVPLPPCPSGYKWLTSDVVPAATRGRGKRRLTSLLCRALQLDFVSFGLATATLIFPKPWLK